MAWDENYSQSETVKRINIPSPAPGKHPTVAVLVPHRGSWPAEYVETMWGPLKFYATDWCNKIYFLCRVPSLPLARNTLVKEFLNSDADFCLWLDDDGLPEEPADPNIAMKALYECLMQTGESIATGLYRAKQVHGFNYAIWMEVTRPDGGVGFANINDWPQTVNWFPVDVAGLGFCMIRRKVYEDMAKAGYGVEGKPFFRWEHPETMSEDFYMLRKADKEFGYKTWCYTGVKISHLGQLVLSTDGKFRVPKV